nr:MAG TPA: hypothetical protein [Crassvirales sp.]
MILKILVNRLIYNILILENQVFVELNHRKYLMLILMAKIYVVSLG